MNILITGASGFIGSRLTNLLTQIGHTISVLTSNPEYINSKVKIYPYDLLKNNNQIENAFTDVDVVIHLASKVHYLSRIQNLEDYYQINVLGTKKLLDVAVKKKLKRFVYLSSIKVHGE